MPRSLSNPTVAHQPKPVVKAKDRDPVAAGQRDAAFNRAASHNYFLTDRFEAGVALRGTEVKSIREGKANLKDAYGLLKDGECFLLNAHIGPFSHGNTMNHDSLRTRKLLLHKREIAKLRVELRDVLVLVVGDDQSASNCLIQVCRLLHSLVGMRKFLHRAHNCRNSPESFD